MALDATLADQLTLDALQGYRHARARLEAAYDNSGDGLAKIQNGFILQGLVNSDDPTTMADLNAADRTPVVKAA